MNTHSDVSDRSPAPSNNSPGFKAYALVREGLLACVAPVVALGPGGDDSFGRRRSFRTLGTFRAPPTLAGATGTTSSPTLVLFTNDILCLFVALQPQKHRLTKLAIMGPLGEFDLGDEYGFNPLAALHDRWGNSESPPAFGFLRQIYKRTRRLSEFLKLVVKVCQDFL